ncbi:MAG: CRISPR-associated endonuclease Cas1 [Myxococcota bacterium]
MERKTLYVTDHEARVHRRQGAIAVSVEGATLEKLPADEVDRVVVFGNGQVTTQAIALLLARGAQVAFFSSSGRYRGQIVSPASGNVFLRMAQHALHGDETFRVDFARELVRTKLTDARGRLLRFRRNHPEATGPLEEAAGHLEGSLRRLASADSVESLRGIEGDGARAYFGVFDHQVRAPLVFERRSRHPAHNEVNALLNLGYTLITNELAGRLEAAGFDPRIGYFHGIRYGRASLALDLVEAHRVRVVDRLTLSALNRRMIGRDDFEDRGDGRGPRLTRRALGRYLAIYEETMGDTIPGELSPRTRIRDQITDLRHRVLSPGREAA